MSIFSFGRAVDLSIIKSVFLEPVEPSLVHSYISVGAVLVKVFYSAIQIKT